MPVDDGHLSRLLEMGEATQQVDYRKLSPEQLIMVLDALWTAVAPAFGDIWVAGDDAVSQKVRGVPGLELDVSFGQAWWSTSLNAYEPGAAYYAIRTDVRFDHRTLRALIVSLAGQLRSQLQRRRAERPENVINAALRLDALAWRIGVSLRYGCWPQDYFEEEDLGALVLAALAVIPKRTMS